MTDSTKEKLKLLYSILDKTTQNAKTRSQQIIPELEFRKEKQKVVIPELSLKAFLNILNRSEKDFLAYLMNKTGTNGATIPGMGLSLRGAIPLETLTRVKDEFIKSVECEICNSIETTLINGVKRCLACS